MSKPKRSRTVVALMLLALVATVGFAFYIDSHAGDPSTDGGSTGSSHPAPTPAVLKGYTSDDLFGDGRVVFQYKDNTWEEARVERAQKGVRAIALTTHCDIMDRAALCPRLTITDMGSAAFKDKFGSNASAARVMNVLVQERCRPEKTADGENLSQVAGTFEHVGTFNVGGKMVPYYTQQLCGPDVKAPVKIHRHVWFAKELGLLIELKGGEYVPMDVAQDFEDVETSLRHLARN